MTWWTFCPYPAQRDQALNHLQGPDAWKPAWRKLLHEQRGLPPLDQAFDQVVGPNAWNILMQNGKLPLLPSQLAEDAPLRYGLRHCRHKVVHGMQSPPNRELEPLGSWGAEAVKRLLHPENGWPKTLGWNVQARLPAIRARTQARHARGIQHEGGSSS